MVTKGYSAALLMQSQSRFALEITRCCAAAFALLAWLFVYAPRAEASCGDYVMIGGHHADGASSNAARDWTAPDTIARQSPGGRAPKRCRGPFCSNGSIPPAAPVAPHRLSIERWAALRPVIDAHMLWVQFSSPDSESEPGSADGLAVFRPPRSQA